MERYEADDDALNFGRKAEKRLTLIDNLTRSRFDNAGRLIDDKLQTAMASLEQSTAALQLLLSAQSAAELASAAGQTMRDDLETLLASSTHLSRLAALMQQDFHTSRQACEQRSEQKIAKVVQAIAHHRATVQDNAIALTEAALSKARASSPQGKPDRSDDRRAG